MKIEIKNLTKKFKDELVLDNININFESGRIYGIVGKNGSGKSVLLKILCGFYLPTEGEILQDGYNYISRNEFPKNTRALIDYPAFLPDLSGLENLVMLAKIQNKISKEDILELMKKLNLFNQKDKQFKKYSLGTKQKLGIAQVLMENPDLIILDEPLNGVEKESAEIIRNILIEEKNKGKIIVIATHIKDDVEMLCEEVFKMEDGKISKIN